MNAPFNPTRRTPPRQSQSLRAAAALGRGIARIAAPLHRVYTVLLFHGRTWIVLSALATTGLFGAVAYKLYQMQAVAPRDQTAIGSNRQIEYFSEPRARRGAIYDRHGADHPLAISVASWIVFADAQEISDETAPKSTGASPPSAPSTRNASSRPSPKHRGATTSSAKSWTKTSAVKSKATPSSPAASAATKSSSASTLSGARCATSSASSTPRASAPTASR